MNYKLYKASIHEEPGGSRRELGGAGGSWGGGWVAGGAGWPGLILPCKVGQLLLQTLQSARWKSTGFINHWVTLRPTYAALNLSQLTSPQTWSLFHNDNRTVTVEPETRTHSQRQCFLRISSCKNFVCWVCVRQRCSQRFSVSKVSDLKLA